MTEEIWLPISGYVGRYEVSSLGRVRSIDRMEPHNWAGQQFRRGGLLKPRLSKFGYPVVGLRSGIKNRWHVEVHRLVALAFVPNPDGKPNVNHLDNDPGNPRRENLEWCTQAENVAHMIAQGRGRGRAKANPSSQPEGRERS